MSTEVNVAKKAIQARIADFEKSVKGIESKAKAS
jgi:hypothetical protein